MIQNLQVIEPTPNTYKLISSAHKSCSLLEKPVADLGRAPPTPDQKILDLMEFFNNFYKLYVGALASWINLLVKIIELKTESITSNTINFP